MQVRAMDDDYKHPRFLTSKQQASSKRGREERERFASGKHKRDLFSFTH